MAVRSVLAIAVVAAGLAAIREATAADAQRTFQEATADGGELKYLDGIPVLFLAGEPEEMGRQQAALVFDVARRHTNLPKAIVGRYGGGSFGRWWSRAAAT